MCNYRILANNKNGNIVFCENCKNYQLAFGTTIVFLSKFQYSEFKSDIENQVFSYKDIGFSKQKEIQVNIFSSNAQLILCHKELLQFKELIEEAEVLEEVDLILNLKTS